MATHRLSTLHPTSCYPKYSLRKKSRHIPKFLIFFLEPVSMVYQPFTLFDVMGTNFSRRLRYLPHPCEVPLSSKMGQWKRSCRKKVWNICASISHSKKDSIHDTSKEDKTHDIGYPSFRDDKMKEYLLVTKLCWFDPYNLFVSGIATPFHDFNWTYSVD